MGGLTDGDTYTFTVTATNTAGTGPSSSASSPVTPAGVPDAPTDVAATPQDGAATVTWDPPATDNGSTISGYTVTATDTTTPGNGNETCGWTSGPRTCTVTALTDGDTYTFAVTATNAVGTGPSSSASSPVTPAGVPDAPTDVAATPQDGAATVTWDPPATDNGSTISGYTVTATDTTTPGNGNETCGWTSGPRTCTVTALTDGDTYTFAVTATNAVGTGPSSSASSPVTPAGVPDAPTGATAVGAEASAMVTWSAPTSDGGSPILGYTVTATDQTTSANGNETCAGTPGALTCLVAGLFDGDVYTFTVVATNSVGDSQASDPTNDVTPGP